MEWDFTNVDKQQGALALFFTYCMCATTGLDLWVECDYCMIFLHLNEHHSSLRAQSSFQKYKPSSWLKQQDPGPPAVSINRFPAPLIKIFSFTKPSLLDDTSRIDKGGKLRIPKTISEG